LLVQPPSVRLRLAAPDMAIQGVLKEREKSLTGSSIVSQRGSHHLETVGSLQIEIREELSAPLPREEQPVHAIELKSPHAGEGAHAWL
jgi:hypothetical protein